MKMKNMETGRRFRSPFPVGLSWLRRRIEGPLLGLLRTGLTPRGLAWSLASGLALGVFPMLGSTTLLCLAAAQVFRLNLPAMQLASFLVYPLQLTLLIPFFRLGARLFGAAPPSHSLPTLLAAVKADPFGTLARAGSMIGHAVVVWAFLALPAMVLLVFLLRPMLETALSRFGGIPDGRPIL